MTKDQIAENPDPSKHWKNRRRMAWLALVAGLFYPLLFIFVDSQNLATVAWPVMTFAGSVVAVYTGAATWETVQINGK